MVATQFSKFVRQLRVVLARQETAALTDADLWERYLEPDHA